MRWNAGLDYRGIAREQVMAIGDNYNDIEMLAFAGLPFIMGNAAEGYAPRRMAGNPYECREWCGGGHRTGIGRGARAEQVISSGNVLSECCSHAKNVLAFYEL